MMIGKTRRAVIKGLSVLGAAGVAASGRAASGSRSAIASGGSMVVDCRDFPGLDAAGERPSEGAINAAIAAGIDHHLPVYLGPGTYRIAHPLIANPLAVRHGYVNLQFCGAGGLGSLDPIGFSSRANTVIAPTFRDRPAFALDLMSGAALRDFAIQGLNVAPNDIDMPLDDPNRYISSGCRNNRHSPYCAIAVDAFNNLGIAKEDRYPGMEDRYFLQGGGTVGLTLENIWIANFVVGVAYGISGLAANTEDIAFNNLWISRVDSCYVVGHSQARHCLMHMGNLHASRQGIDGLHYGTLTGCPPKFARVNHGYLYRIFSMPNSIGSFVLDDNYAESIRTLGNFGVGSGYSRQPLSFIGGDYTITSQESFTAPPPLLLETHSPTAFKGVGITRDANATAVDALNVIAADAICSFEQCYLPGTATANVPPFIGLVKDASHVQCRLVDCHVGSATGSSMYLSDDGPRSFGIAPFAPGGRYAATYQSRRVTDGQREYLYQPNSSNVQFPIEVTELSLSRGGPGRLGFRTARSQLLVGDILFWRMLAQGPSLMQWVVPALKVTHIEAGQVNCRLLFDSLQYDSVANWNTYNSGFMFIVIRQWAPAVPLTCRMHDSSTISELDPASVLIGSGAGLAGDWVAGAGIPEHTRVLSVDAKAGTAFLSQSTTGGPANRVRLYFGRLYAPALTPAF